MAFTIQNNYVTAAQLVAATDTVKQMPVGTVVVGYDPVYGRGEFIYLKGVASTAAGSVVTYDARPAVGTTALAVAGARGPVAVAMSASVANQYGFYQITGTAVVKAVTIAADKPLYATATPGTVDDAVVTGDKIDGFVSKTADGTPSAGLALVQLSSPDLNGNG